MANLFQLLSSPNLSSSNKTIPSCTPSVDYQLYLHLSLAPAFFIIALLSLYIRRVTKHACWGGIPGLLIPINFFSVQRKRASIALAFGATAGSILLLITNPNYFVSTEKSQWIKSLIKLFSVVELGIIYFPVLACLTFQGNDGRMLSSLLGFLYTLPRFAVEVNQVLDCPGGEVASKSIIPYYSLLASFPVIFCLLFITLDFFITFVMSVYEHFNSRLAQPAVFRDLAASVLPMEEEPIAGKHDFRYVRKIIRGSYHEEHRQWYMCIIQVFYQPRADFKFCMQIITTIVVATILVYQLQIEVIVSGNFLFQQGKAVIGKQNVYGEFFQYFGLACLVGSLILFVYLIFLILHLLSTHRANMLKVWKGNRKFLPDFIPSPATMVRLSLRYSGYQIAYIFWGFVVMNLIMLIVVFIVTALWVYWPRFPPEVKEACFQFIEGVVLPYFVFFVIVWLIQYILSWVAFRDYSFPNITININNPRMYHISNFLFFFYGIIVGVWVALSRILKAIVLGVILLPRIDHNSLMEGFHLMDNGYMAYLGYLFVSAAYRNPVLLVFCQFLLDEKKKKAAQESASPRLAFQASVSYGTLAEQTTGVEDVRPRFSKRGLNRWFLAAMLIANPQLISYRKHVRFPQLLPGLREVKSFERSL